MSRVLTTDAWVRAVNQLARELDDYAAGTHPTALTDDPAYQRLRADYVATAGSVTVDDPAAIPTPGHARGVLRRAGYLIQPAPAGRGSHRWRVSRGGRLVNVQDADLPALALRVQDGQTIERAWPLQTPDSFDAGATVRLRGTLRCGVVVADPAFRAALVRVVWDDAVDWEPVEASALDLLPTPPGVTLALAGPAALDEVRAARRWRLLRAVESTGAALVVARRAPGYGPPIAGYALWAGQTVRAVEASPARRGVGRALIQWLQWRSVALAASGGPAPFWERLGFVADGAGWTWRHAPPK